MANQNDTILIFDKDCIIIEDALQIFEDFEGGGGMVWVENFVDEELKPAALTPLNQRDLCVGPSTSVGCTISQFLFLAMLQSRLSKKVDFPLEEAEVWIGTEDGEHSNACREVRLTPEGDLVLSTCLEQSS